MSSHLSWTRRKQSIDAGQRRTAVAKNFRDPREKFYMHGQQQVSGSRSSLRASRQVRGEVVLYIVKHTRSTEALIAFSRLQTLKVYSVM